MSLFHSTTTKLSDITQMLTKILAAAKSIYTQAGVSCFYDSEVVNQSSVLRNLLPSPSRKSLAASENDKNMRILVLIILLTLTLNLFGQSSQCDLLKSASISFCKSEYKSTLDTLIKFRHDFPKHALIEEVNQQIAHLYLLTNDLNKAKVELEEIINGKSTGQDNNEYDASECKTYYGSTNFNCMRIVFPEPYIHLQHWAALDLYEIYLKENNFDKALLYLQAADNKYTFNYGCGNGDMQKSIEIALLYGQLYENMNLPDSALKKLLPYSFETYLTDYSQTTEMAISILKRHFKINEIREQFDKAIENVATEQIKRTNGETYIEYSIQFMGNKIYLAYPDWTKKEFSKLDMQQQLKTSLFYKQLEE